MGEIPSYHIAKPAAEYIKKLDKDIENGPMSMLYSILCQFAHPAAHSIHYLFQTGFDGEKYLFQYDNNTEKTNIETILKDYNAEVIDSLYFGFNPGLVILKTLNFFDYELTKTPYLDKIEFGTMKAWVDIKAKINQCPA